MSIFPQQVTKYSSCILKHERLGCHSRKFFYNQCSRLITLWVILNSIVLIRCFDDSVRYHHMMFPPNCVFLGMIPQSVIYIYIYIPLPIYTSSPGKTSVIALRTQNWGHGGWEGKENHQCSSQASIPDRLIWQPKSIQISPTPNATGFKWMVKWWEYVRVPFSLLVLPFWGFASPFVLFSMSGCRIRFHALMHWVPRATVQGAGHPNRWEVELQWHLKGWSCEDIKRQMTLSIANFIPIFGTNWENPQRTKHFLVSSDISWPDNYLILGSWQSLPILPAPALDLAEMTLRCWSRRVENVGASFELMAMKHADRPSCMEWVATSKRNQPFSIREQMGGPCPSRWSLPYVFHQCTSLEPKYVQIWFLTCCLYSPAPKAWLSKKTRVPNAMA